MEKMKMSENRSSWSRQRFMRIGLFALLGLLFLARIGYGQLPLGDNKNVILQGSIHIQPVQAVPDDQTGKIQPGTPVKLSVTVENKGQQASPAGQLYVRYAFAHPLDKDEASVIFKTEKKPLPTIEPGKKVDIAFDTPHQIPSLLDFVRYDWSIREYQAMAVVNQEEHMIGSLAITFSAYYYPGIKKEFPIKISAHEKN
jgi:hypothetical protein